MLSLGTIGEDSFPEMLSTGPEDLNHKFPGARLVRFESMLRDCYFFNNSSSHKDISFDFTL